MAGLRSATAGDASRATSLPGTRIPVSLIGGRTVHRRAPLGDGPFSPFPNPLTPNPSQKGYFFPISCLGMHEAVNFLSNLDGRKIEFDRELRQLCATGKVSFPQLYADSPHVHLYSHFKHPLSRTIVTAGLAHPQYLSAMERRARDYLLHMEDLVNKVPCPLALRVEQVAIFDATEGFPPVLVAEEFFRVRRVHHLLHKEALILPFTVSGDELDD